MWSRCGILDSLVYRPRFAKSPGAHRAQAGENHEVNQNHDPSASRTYAYEVDPAFPELPEGGVLGEVSGVAVDHEDRVYVANRSTNPVQIYSTDGQFLSSWSYSDFERVHGVTIAPDGRIYIADDRRHLIRVFNPAGELVLTIGTDGVPSDTGVEDRNPRTIKHAGPPFNLPTDTAPTADGSFYVSDGYGNARVHHFSHEGELLQSWGEPGTGPGEFNLPHGVTIDNEGRVLVADRENGRIQVFSADGTYETEFNDLIRPCGMCVDGDGVIYVAELAQSYGRITILSPKGELLEQWAIAGDVPKVGAHSIALDSEKNLYVGLVYQGAPLPENARPVIKYRRV